PWWRYYGEFSTYISRLSHMLSGGRHVAKVAVLWPINALFATNTPQGSTLLASREEIDFGVLTDILLRIHYDFDYLDEDFLADAELKDGKIHIRDEAYELLIVPPAAHVKLSTVEKLEEFVQEGGKVLGTIFLPDKAFADGRQELVDVSSRVQDLFGVDPTESQRNYRKHLQSDVSTKKHAGGGKTSFFHSYALRRGLPKRLQEELGIPGVPEHPDFVIESEGELTKYYFAPPGKERQDITAEVEVSRRSVYQSLQEVIYGLIEPDVVINNPEVFYLHRVKDSQDIYFMVNTTFREQTANVILSGEIQPVIWNPSLGSETPVAPLEMANGKTRFPLTLPPAGSLFILIKPVDLAYIHYTNLTIDKIEGGIVRGYGRSGEGTVVTSKDGKDLRIERKGKHPPEPVFLDGEWTFHAEQDNALVIRKWLAAQETQDRDITYYTTKQSLENGWLEMVPGAWEYQLPAEPDSLYPIPVWFQAAFQTEYLPPKLDLIVDGFAGSEWKLFVNGGAVTSPPERSTFDAQMKAVDITRCLKKGVNVISLRLVLDAPTDGLLDLLKLCGKFSLELLPDGEYQIAAPRSTSNLAPWNREGYPFYSGSAIYSRHFRLPGGSEGDTGLRLFIDVPAGDDVVEVILNGKQAGICLWAPYTVEITSLVQPGENKIEIRTANTLINLLEAVGRPSGLCGAPRLVMYRQFEFELPQGGE
ncbi:MAG: hypothetical protein EHM41_12315, partial [Chloroflexi bacterium]